jgi:hypothetical protein
LLFVIAANSISKTCPELAYGFGFGFGFCPMRGGFIHGDKKISANIACSATDTGANSYY